MTENSTATAEHVNNNNNTTNLRQDNIWTSRRHPCASTLTSLPPASFTTWTSRLCDKLTDHLVDQRTDQPGDNNIIPLLTDLRQDIRLDQVLIYTFPDMFITCFQ